MEPKTPALGKNPEMFFREPPILLSPKNHVKKRIAKHSAPLNVADFDGCNNSVSRGFKEARSIVKQ